MTELHGPGKTSRFELGTRELGRNGYGYIDIESGTGFGLMDLECHTINNGIRDLRRREDPGKR